MNLRIGYQLEARVLHVYEQYLEVLVFGRFVRIFFSGSSTVIMFLEQPNMDRVINLCLDIFLNYKYNMYVNIFSIICITWQNLHHKFIYIFNPVLILSILSSWQEIDIKILIWQTSPLLVAIGGIPDVCPNQLIGHRSENLERTPFWEYP
jgi:hypothetical protein